MDKTNRIKELVKLLNEASKAYYQEDTEIMSNLEYDTLYDDSWKNCTAYGVFTNESEKIAGYLEVSRENWNDRLRITNLLVLEEFRGHGIGSFLINKAKSVAESENRRIIVLETQSCNVPAIDFYLKHGFVFAGTNLYFYSNCDIAEDEVMIEMAYLY